MEGISSLPTFNVAQSIVQPMGWRPVESKPDDISDLTFTQFKPTDKYNFDKREVFIKLTRKIVNEISNIGRFNPKGNYEMIKLVDEYIVNNVELRTKYRGKPEKWSEDKMNKYILIREKYEKLKNELFDKDRLSKDTKEFIRQQPQRVIDIQRKLREIKKRIKDNKKQIQVLEENRNFDAEDKLEEARKKLRLLVPEVKQNVSEKKFIKARKKLSKKVVVDPEIQKLKKIIKKDEDNLKKFSDFTGKVRLDPEYIVQSKSVLGLIYEELRKKR